jgi:hypothetical protein
MKKYTDNKQNHVILPGREKAFEQFINSTHNGEKHKLKNSYSSNSEDALTWSCFDVLAQFPIKQKIIALNEILSHSYDDEQSLFSFEHEQNIRIDVGKTYKPLTLNEETEVDANIETDKKIVFIEAKLYSSISLKDSTHDYDQIARKLRVGLKYALENNLEFYFLFLDIAPMEKLYDFSKELKCKENAEQHPTAKWKSAWWFKYYKNGANGSLRPLKEALLDCLPVENQENIILNISKNMGWLVWSDLYKIILRGAITK